VKAPQLASALTGLDSDQPNPAVSGKWAMIPLIRNGEPVTEFASLCSETMRLIQRIDLPRLRMISPSLYFSVLEPHGRIPPHVGITNARVIVHWPLVVPARTGFRVGGTTRTWMPGQALVFDDMTEHEVWNNSDRLRVVLISDLWRPELSRGERSEIERLMNRPLAA
jgi:aspartyl/asparaginyl beta-hydroxylase (cupin superfamily)